MFKLKSEKFGDFVAPTETNKQEVPFSHKTQSLDIEVHDLQDNFRESK